MHPSPSFHTLTTLLFAFSAAPLALAQSVPATDSGVRVSRAVPSAAERVAVAYLEALAGRGDPADLDLLLGGATLTAEDFRIPNWRITKREPVRHEVGDLAAAKREVDRVQSVGHDALNHVMALDGETDGVTRINEAQAESLMAPTKVRAARFQRRFPVFAYLARADKEVFWHPSNPFLSTVEKMHGGGEYRAELHLFHIEEARGNKTRTWPLRVLRIQARGYDTGYKILPASNWDPEY